MTREQIQQWKECSCVSRCFLEAARTKGQSFTLRRFWKLFGPTFPQGQFGGMILSALIDICRVTKVGSQFEFCFDYALTEQLFNQKKRFIFVLSGRDFNVDASNNHCSILKQISKDQFTLLVPATNGKSYLFPPFPASAWREKQCCALMMI